MKCTNFEKLYQPIYEMEKAELIAAVKAHGGKYVFSEYEMPIINGYAHYGDYPADIAITSVSFDGQVLEIIGHEMGCGNDELVDADCIAFGHIQYIIGAIPETDEVKDVTTFNK